MNRSGKLIKKLVILKEECCIIMWRLPDYTAEHFGDVLAMTRENYGLNIDIFKEDFITYQYFHDQYGDAAIQLACYYNGLNKTRHKFRKR